MTETKTKETTIFNNEKDKKFILTGSYNAYLIYFIKLFPGEPYFASV